MSSISYQEGTLELSPLYPYDLVDLDRSRSEKTLNLLGYIPAFSSCTGAYRILDGVIGVVFSLAKAILLAIPDSIFRDSQLPSRSYKHLTYVGHNTCNILRGVVELVPVLGNIATFTYDGLIGRVSYDVEKTGPHYIIKK